MAQDNYFNNLWRKQILTELKNWETTVDDLQNLARSLEESLDNKKNELMKLFTDEVEIRKFRIQVCKLKNIEWRIQNLQKIIKLKEYDDLLESIKFIKNLILEAS